jgi:hypothetical protein
MIRNDERNGIVTPKDHVTAFLSPDEESFLCLTREHTPVMKDQAVCSYGDEKRFKSLLPEAILSWIQDDLSRDLVPEDYPIGAILRHTGDGQAASPVG